MRAAPVSAKLERREAQLDGVDEVAVFKGPHLRDGRVRLDAPRLVGEARGRVREVEPVGEGGWRRADLDEQLA